jgi:alpha-D-ribose 1-methylphosphonate 5-triphosphate synthase subunit PhnG
MDRSGDKAGDQTARRRWLGVLAKAAPAALEQAFDALESKPTYRFLRAPAAGAAMVRGRAGGGGQPFNLGEITVARCTVVLDETLIGVGYVKGRNLRHAELTAVFDALLQDAARAPAIERGVIQPLEAAHHAERKQRQAESAATRVNFFTMVRGS